MRASISTWLCSSGGHAGRAGAGQEQGSNGLRLQQAAQGVVHQQPYCQVEGSPGLSPHDPTATEKKQTRKNWVKWPGVRKFQENTKMSQWKPWVLCQACCVTHLAHAVWQTWCMLCDRPGAHCQSAQRLPTQPPTCTSMPTPGQHRKHFLPCKMQGERATNPSKRVGLSRYKCCYQSKPTLPSGVCAGCSMQSPCPRLSMWEALGHPWSPPNPTTTKGRGQELCVLCHTMRAMPEKINILTPDNPRIYRKTFSVLWNVKADHGAWVLG